MTDVASQMRYITQVLISEHRQEKNYLPDVSDDFGTHLKIATTECYDDIVAAEKREELTLLPLHPNAPQYFPLTIEEDKTCSIPISKHVTQCDNRLWDNNGEEFTNFIILDDRTLVKKTDGSADVEFTVVAENGFHKKLCLPIAEFREGAWYRDFQGLTCYNMKYFREYLEILCSDILPKEKHRIQNEGWHKDERGYWRMLTHHGTVTDTSYLVEIEEDGTSVHPVSRFSEADLAKHFWEMRFLTKSSAALIIMVYTILASLYTFFATAGATPKFILGILGPRSSRKTSLAMTMANLYKRESGMTPYITFKTSTPSGIEQRLRKFKDAVMIVDDLMPTSNKTLQRRVETVLEHICRLFGDGAESARNTDFLSKERADKVNYKAAGLCLFTGEYFTGVASSRSRCVTVKISQDTVDNERLAFFQENLDILPGFLWNFLAFVEKNQDKIFQYIRENVLLVRRDFQNTYEVARFAEYQAQMETAIGILFAYFSHLCLMPDEVMEHGLHVFRDKFCYILLENQREMVETDPISQIRQTIQHFCEEFPDKMGNINDIPLQKSELYESGDYLYIHPQWLFEKICEYTKARGEGCAIIDISYLKSVLDSSGYLARKMDGNINRYSVKLPNASKIQDHRRFLRISKKILDATQAENC